MPGCLIAFFGIFIPFSFFGEDVEKFWSWYILQVPERLCKSDNVMTINWSEISKMERFKEVAVLHEYSFESLFCLFEKFFGK